MTRSGAAVVLNATARRAWWPFSWESIGGVGKTARLGKIEGTSGMMRNSAPVWERSKAKNRSERGEVYQLTRCANGQKSKIKDPSSEMPRQMAYGTRALATRRAAPVKHRHFSSLRSSLRRQAPFAPGPKNDVAVWYGRPEAVTRTDVAPPGTTRDDDDVLRTLPMEPVRGDWP